jgi:hypothetical protein
MASKIPASCAHLDPAAIYDELLRTGGNVTETARTLGVPIHDLRLLTLASPGLIEAALEAEEQALDEAEAVVRQALKSVDLSRRLAAAGHILRMSPAAKRRGWGSAPAADSQGEEPQGVTLKWLEPS